MPPKKRAAPAVAVATPAKRAKKVSIGGTSIIDESATPLASGRSKRAGIGQPNYSLNRAKKEPAPPVAANKPARTAVASKEKSAGSPTKKRGRPANSAPVAPLVHSDVPKARGRPRKDTATASSAEAPATPPKTAKPRGRPPISSAKASSAARKLLKPSTKTKKPVKPANNSKAKATAAATAADNTEEAVAADDGEDTAKESDWEHADEPQYWLMKAEPDSRLENGHDVAFSIDHLRRATAPEPWDGVRNLVARNNMRAMKEGDQAFFYHSNCKTPGIAGIMEIVEEHTVDKSAFDKGHPYYDPKSDPEKPKWENVHVKFVRKFPALVTLTQLKSFAKEGGVLAGMQMLRQSRLSVSSVQPAEWHFIMGLVDSPDDELEEDAEPARGQVVQVVETTVRSLPNGAADDAHLNGFDSDDEGDNGGGKGAIQNKLTLARSVGAEAPMTNE